MKTEFFMINSAYKHLPEHGSPTPEDALTQISVCKNEEFGFQLLIQSTQEFTTALGFEPSISWKGMLDNYRIAFHAHNENSSDASAYFTLHLLDYAYDDDKNPVADIFLNGPVHHTATKDQIVYISGKLPSDFTSGILTFQLQAFHSKGYQDETLIYDQKIAIFVQNYALMDLRNSSFHLDLWQHPSNWARYYDVPCYSSDHMQIMHEYMDQMAQIGQKVCGLIISDFPWAGQRCYTVEDNHANLFESNIVKVSRDLQGHILCDFSFMDQYIQMAENLGISEEINLFGILGNWDSFDFGNPLEDFKDPIRIRCFDSLSQTFGYIHTKEELSSYLGQVFDHLHELGFWKKTYIISDEPNDTALFRESISLFHHASPQLKPKIKCAIHHQQFFEEYQDNITSLSLNTCELVNIWPKLPQIKEKITKKRGKLTWYSCCFPTPLNIFLKSPLIESRLVGWFTFYMNLHGFLRWTYGVWPGDVYKDASYKTEKWSAGDMFFVYPGKNAKPLSSLRLKNFIYGLQDWLLLQDAAKILGQDFVEKKLSSLLGEKSQMAFVPEREVDLHHSLCYKDYMSLREDLLSHLLKNPVEVNHDHKNL